MAELTPKQDLFVREYLVDLNATQAAIRAGYSAQYADRIGSELLGKTRVAEAIAVKKAERSAKVGLTAERVLEEYARIAFSDMGDFAAWDSDGVTFMPSSHVDTRVVAEVKETPMKGGGKALGIKLHDKVGALNAVAKHLGMLPDKVDQSGSVTVKVEYVNSPEPDAS